MLKNNTCLLSVIIVNFNSKEFLFQCLKSICNAEFNGSLEIWVVDNGSMDSSVEMLTKEFPDVHCIFETENKGFAFANNRALKQVQSKYILLLNPDTILVDDVLNKLVEFMNLHPNVGICGPKLLNKDGTFQPQCKRGFPTPIVVLSYFLKLHLLFPKNKIFGKYLLTYLNPDLINEVDSVSGACMLMRKEALDSVGFLDENFFMYGEDIDLCYRVKKLGWKIYYIPDALVMHYGGHGGTQQRPYKCIYHFYRSAFIFYRKNLSSNYFFILNWFINLGILLAFLFAIVSNFFHSQKYVGSRKPY